MYTGLGARVCSRMRTRNTRPESSGGTATTTTATTCSYRNAHIVCVSAIIMALLPRKVHRTPKHDKRGEQRHPNEREHGTYTGPTVVALLKAID